MSPATRPINSTGLTLPSASASSQPQKRRCTPASKRRASTRDQGRLAVATNAAARSTTHHQATKSRSQSSFMHVPSRTTKDPPPMRRCTTDASTYRKFTSSKRPLLPGAEKARKRCRAAYLATALKPASKSTILTVSRRSGHAQPALTRSSTLSGGEKNTRLTLTTTGAIVATSPNVSSPLKSATKPKCTDRWRSTAKTLLTADCAKFTKTYARIKIYSLLPTGTVRKVESTRVIPCTSSLRTENSTTPMPTRP